MSKIYDLIPRLNISIEVKTISYMFVICLNIKFSITIMFLTTSQSQCFPQHILAMTTNKDPQEYISANY